MRILFIGCVDSSYILLRQLINQNKDIVGVVTVKESAYNSDFRSLEELCAENGIDCGFYADVNSNEAIQFIKRKRPDIIYCFGWSRLIKERVLRIPSLGVVGFHPAALPYNKGRHPLIWALALGLNQTASTFFIMDANADSGDIVSQVLIEIDYTDDAETLYKKVMHAAEQQVIDFTEAFENGVLSATPQDSSMGNTWRKRGFADGQIDWRMSSRAIYNLVRALTKPYIGSHFMHNGKEVKVWKVREEVWEGVSNLEAGKVLKVVSPHEFYVKAYDNVIHVLACEDVDVKEGEYL